MNYVFVNKTKSIEEIIKKMISLIKLDIIDKNIEYCTLGNKDLIIDIDETRTFIYLFENINIKELIRYFMEE